MSSLFIWNSQRVTFLAIIYEKVNIQGLHLRGILLSWFIYEVGNCLPGCRQTGSSSLGSRPRGRTCWGSSPRCSSHAGSPVQQIISWFIQPEVASAFTCYQLTVKDPYKQRWGSVTFWCGSGSADPYLWLMDPAPDPDPTPDPTPFFSDFKDSKKIVFS